MRPAEICLQPSRALAARHGGKNGIDYVEVGRELGGPTLTVYFFGPVPEELEPKHFTITGGARITGIRVVDTRLCRTENPEREECAFLLVDKDGDFSTYTLVVTGIEGFDPVYSEFDFSFRVDTSHDLDCRQQRSCPTDGREEPEISYLAKDYASFRQAILDRWALIMPSWQERHVPDLGIALAEVLAYTGDYLSYYQDAVATEAYLKTARERISVRRHTRLVGYNVHEGCNARAWICIETDSDLPPLNPEDFFFITHGTGVPAGTVIQQDALRLTPTTAYLAFEPIAQEPIQLYKAHSSIRFYTWGNTQCCLPAGSVQATLRDEWEDLPAQQADKERIPAVSEQSGVAYEKAAAPTGKKQRSSRSQRKEEEGPQYAEDAQKYPPEHARFRALRHLKPGDILILQEVKGPDTGLTADADPQKRHAVRLTRVERGVDQLYGVPFVNIWWGPQDSVPFAMCLSSLGGAPNCELFEDCTVACANVLLADHGQSIKGEPLRGFVPVLPSCQNCLGEKRPDEYVLSPGAFNPVLNSGPLTFRQAVRPGLPASKMLLQEPRQAVPQITLQMRTLTGVWDVTSGNHRHATLLFEQDGTNLRGSYTGELGKNLVVRGTVTEDWSSASFGIYKPSAEDKPEATVFCTIANQTLTGEMDQGQPGKMPFYAKGRRKDPDWSARTDLLGSGPRDNHFVVEVDNDSLANLRFGDGELGRAPEAGAGFVTSFRVGCGSQGNVSRDTIRQMVLRTSISNLGITSIANPLPGSGGAEPETLADIKLLAPSAFQTGLQRAITADDYATLAAAHLKVQRAAAVLRWTGIRYAVQVTIDPLGTEKNSPALLEEIKHYLYRFRRIGHDLEVLPSRYVPLDLGIRINVQPNFLHGHVEAAVLDQFSAKILPDGRRGFFHPDNLTFGDSIFASRLIAAAQAVDGVKSVEITRLERLYQGPNHEVQNGVLPIGPLEIARLDNDPNFPENGKLNLAIGGGGL